MSITRPLVPAAASMYFGTCDACTDESLRYATSADSFWTVSPGRSFVRLPAEPGAGSGTRVTLNSCDVALSRSTRTDAEPQAPRVIDAAMSRRRVGSFDAA